jgi:hypothetical protein
MGYSKYELVRSAVVSPKIGSRKCYETLISGILGKRKINKIHQIDGILYLLLLGNPKTG